MASARVGIYGTGRTACELIRQLEQSPYQVVAVIAHNPANAGRELESLIQGVAAGIRTTADVDGVLRDVRPDVLLYAGLGGGVLVDVMRRCLEAGIDFINATFIHPATALGKSAQELDELAKTTGARGLGTGVNPGLWLDVLPALIATACEGRPRVSAQRVTDIRHWGADVLRNEVGIGRFSDKPPPRFYDSLTESALVLAEALAVELDEIRRTGRAILAATPTHLADLEVAPGTVEGFDQAIVGTAGGEVVLEIGWIGIPNPPAKGLSTGVELELVGGDGNGVRAHVATPLDPYPGTAARMIKAIRPLGELAPGLHTPAAIHRLANSSWEVDDQN